MVRKIHSLIIIGVLLLLPGSALAVYTSPSYQANEVQFGVGSGLQSSASYQAQSSVGDLGVGNAKSSNFQTEAGFNTTATPFLEVFVASGSIDMGTLSTISTATATATFHVRDYLSSGYVVQSVSKPPHYGTHSIQPLLTPGASVAGTEQFGMNLAANTNPVTFGAMPAQVPDSTFGFGYATNGYELTNQFKYNQNDIIARSDKSSGETDFTISYIMNISNTTPGGTYIFNQDLVVTATY